MEALMESLRYFFQGYAAADIMNMIVVAIMFGVPNFGVSFVNYVKLKMEWTKGKAQTFFLFCIAAVTIGTMFVTGQIAGTEFTLKSFVSVFVAALVPAKYAYKRLMGRS